MMICICTQLQVNVFEYDLHFTHLWIITNYILIIICTHHCFDKFTLFRDDFLRKFFLHTWASLFKILTGDTIPLLKLKCPNIGMHMYIYAYIFIPMCFPELWSFWRCNKFFLSFCTWITIYFSLWHRLKNNYFYIIKTVLYLHLNLHWTN